MFLCIFYMFTDVDIHVLYIYIYTYSDVWRVDTNMIASEPAHFRYRST